MNVVSRGRGKFVLLVKRTTHVFTRRAGNFELLWYKYDRVVQEERQLLDPNMADVISRIHFLICFPLTCFSE